MQNGFYSCLAILLVGCGVAAEDLPPPISSPTTTRVKLVADQKTETPKTFRVIGYLPDYRIDSLPADSLDWLTDIVIFSVEVQPDGKLDWKRVPPIRWERIEALRQDRSIQAHLCVGGWDRSAGFEEMAASPAARKTFGDEVVAACAKHRLAGIDLDWEHPSTAKEQTHLTALLQELAQRLHQEKLELSIAVAPSQILPPQAWQAVDRVHLMSYDGTGKHSTYEVAAKDLDRCKQLAIPASAVVLGLPFYGRHEKKRAEAMTFAEIQSRFSPPANVDESHGFYFNGPGTIAKKTRLAIDRGLAGVMLWEIGQDARGPVSLRKAIADEQRK